MRYRTIVSTAALALTLPQAHALSACEALAKSPSVESLLVSKVCAALDAVNAGDANALRELMAEDFALTSASGKYYESSRENMVGRWTAPTPTGTTSTSSLVTVHRTFQAEGFGWVSGVIQDKTTTRGKSRCGLHAFTDIWQLRDGQWLWVQSHESGFKAVRCAS